MVKSPFARLLLQTSRTPSQNILNGEHMIFKHEINMNLATEGFCVVSLESQQPHKNTGSIYNSLGNLDQYLTDADCKAFLDGLENTIHDGELLYEHVTDFTTKILQKWAVET